MHDFPRTFWIVVIVLAGAGAGAAQGQNITFDDVPKIFVPKQPPTRKEMEQRDALKKYVYGLLCDQENKIDEALKAFQEAARLNPEAAAVYKAQVPLLAGMDRLDDALVACERVVDLDPGDFLSWYVLAKLHKSMANYPKAIQALQRGAETDSLKDHPEAGQQLFVELGSLYEGTEKFGLAADAYSRAAAILEHPDRIMEKGDFSREAIQGRAAETYEKIGQLYRRAKRHDQAIQALRKALAHAPERAPRISFHLAEVCLESGKLEEALTYVDVYLGSQPLGLDAYEMKLGLLKRLDKTARIVPWLEEATRRDRWNNGLHLMLAREYVRAKEYTKAETLYKKLAEEAPSADLYRGLFHLYKLEGAAGMSRVLGMLNQVMDKVGTNDGPAPLSKLTHAKAMVGALRDDGDLAKALVEEGFKRISENEDLKFDTVYFLAILADRQRKTEEAERFYERCLPNATPANEALIYGGLLRVLSKAKKYDAIVKTCQVGLKTAKATSPLLFYSDESRALAGLHRYDEALRCADRGLQQAGDDSKMLFKILRVRLLSMAERHEEAETECQALLKAYPRPGETLELRYLLSNVYANAKQHSKAEEQLHLILKIDPNNATVNNDLGYLWADQSKNLEVAESMIRKALEQDRLNRRNSPNFNVDEDKDNAAYVDSLGWVLFRRGQIDEARKELERATTVGDGDDPVIYEHLGDVYLRLEMRPEASRSWQRAFELYNQGARPKEEERVRDIQRKLKQVKEDNGGS